MTYINTESNSARLRARAILPSEKKILIARLSDSAQEKDLLEPTNCQGYGRIRHFRVGKGSDWSQDPLPNLPAAKALGYTPNADQRAQVFQIAVCNWRCWYCFVDYNRLSANPRFSAYFTPDELVSMYLEEENLPEVIDLSGGQPDLVPEWILWTMEAIDSHGLIGRVFLWSDDNLSSEYIWKFLTQEQRRYMAAFSSYSRVGCFKGYDAASFCFNTHAAPECFEQQFVVYQALLREGFDMYAYVTFTGIPHSNLHDKMEQFVDKLQSIHPNLPLRTVPLKIQRYTPTQDRVESAQQRALAFQYEVHSAWLEELGRRFSDFERQIPICDVPMAL